MGHKNGTAAVADVASNDTAARRRQRLPTKRVGDPLYPVYHPEFTLREHSVGVIWRYILNMYLVNMCSNRF